MKNHNVYEFTGDLEKAIKNGDIKQILIFPGVSTQFLKFLNSFPNFKEIEPNETFPYLRKIIKHRSPFRIGEMQIQIIYIEDIITKNNINLSSFKEFIKWFCSKFKNNISGLHISGNLLQFRKEIVDTLNEVVRDTKILILN